jgi:hypothetical protein
MNRIRELGTTQPNFRKHFEKVAQQITEKYPNLDAMINHPLYTIQGKLEDDEKYPIILCDIDLTNQDLGSIDLSDAIMYGAKLNGASLKGANLSDVMLCDASLLGTDLTGANLNNAVLSGADASGAIGLLTYHGDGESQRASQNIQVNHKTKFPFDVLQLFTSGTVVLKPSDQEGRLCVSPEGCDTGFIVFEYSGEYNSDGTLELADLTPFRESIKTQYAKFNNDVTQLNYTHHN